MVMNKKILLDGCSFTYGLNLACEETLEHHFIELGYDVVNLSRPGKGNLAIALDVYQNLKDCDIAVVGWTFSSRWHLKYHNKDFDLLPNREFVELPSLVDAGVIEESYKSLHKSFYSLYDATHWNAVSNMLVETLYAQIMLQHKLATFFSWEPRTTSIPVHYPHVTPSHRLACGHLNATGTTHLFENLIKQIEQ
jgi:hypothetical protein